MAAARKLPGQQHGDDGSLRRKIRGRSAGASASRRWTEIPLGKIREPRRRDFTKPAAARKLPGQQHGGYGCLPWAATGRWMDPSAPRFTRRGAGASASRQQPGGDGNPSAARFSRISDSQAALVGNCGELSGSKTAVRRHGSVAGKIPETASQWLGGFLGTKGIRRRQDLIGFFFFQYSADRWGFMRSGFGSTGWVGASGPAH
jgi:hypothetical protein